jgi:hypothetical protein
MRPPERKKLDYEKVVIGEMISGIIEKVEYDQEHKFKGFQGKDDTVQPAVRLKFKLDGYQYPHYTRWMKFSLGEKANLYKKYVAKLVENAEADMDFDLDVLNDMKIKTVWSEENGFQNIDAIYPVGPKVKASAPIPTIDLDKEEEPPIDPAMPF